MIDVIKCYFIVVMGLIMMILGIYGLLSEGKKSCKTSKLYRQYEQTSEFSKEMINKFYKADHQSILKKGYPQYTCMDMYSGGEIAVLFGLLMIWSGVTIGRKRVAENDMVDGIIHDKVVKIDTSSQMFPGYGRMVIEYQDPYDGSINRYF